jgi:hypothetical protein
MVILDIEQKKTQTFSHLPLPLGSMVMLCELVYVALRSQC